MLGCGCGNETIPIYISAENGNDGADGLPGVDGWTPVYAIALDGERKVLKLVDYIGGTGVKPTANLNKFVATTGFVTDIALAENLKGDAGVGTSGTNGWTPEFMLVADGERRVLRINSWLNGVGTPPPVGYLTAGGGVSPDIASGLDIRGIAGASGVSVSSYTYFAYATGTDGSGFSLVPDNSHKYIQVKVSPVPIPSPSIVDFTGVWVKYIGESGSMLRKQLTAGNEGTFVGGIRNFFVENTLYAPFVFHEFQFSGYISTKVAGQLTWQIKLGDTTDHTVATTLVHRNFNVTETVESMKTFQYNLYTNKRYVFLVINTTATPVLTGPSGINLIQMD